MTAVRLGLRDNAGQFALLVAVNALVGAMVGQERAILPLLARTEFGLSSASATLGFLVAFGISKALANLLAGILADRVGRKPVLVAGWLLGVPVPLLIIATPDWSWVVAANVLLGINQGLTWSTTVIMKIDLVGPTRRGLALGLNEASGYLAVAGAALLTGLVAERAGLRPAPFLFGLAIAGIGLGLSAVLVRETRDHVALDQASHAAAGAGRAGGTDGARAWRWVLWRASWADRRLFAASQAGLVNNLNDGLAWGLLPLHFAARGLPLGEIAVLAALYPATWGLLQVAAGALSDRVGRVPLIVTGMLVQGVALAVIAASDGFWPWAVGAVTLGLGTALVYPTLIARVSDLAAPAWRASAIGVYRLWRDLGFAAGAVLAGLVADAAGVPAAVALVAVLTAASGLVVATIGRGQAS